MRQDKTGTGSDPKERTGRRRRRRYNKKWNQLIGDTNKKCRLVLVVDFSGGDEIRGEGFVGADAADPWVGVIEADSRG